MGESDFWFQGYVWKMNIHIKLMRSQNLSPPKKKAWGIRDGTHLERCLTNYQGGTLIMSQRSTQISVAAEEQGSALPEGQWSSIKAATAFSYKIQDWLKTVQHMPEHLRDLVLNPSGTYFFLAHSPRPCPTSSPSHHPTTVPQGASSTAAKWRICVFSPWLWGPWLFWTG